MDVTFWMAGLACFLLVLAAMGAVADGWERRDARRRNAGGWRYRR